MVQVRADTTQLSVASASSNYSLSWGKYWVPIYLAYHSCTCAFHFQNLYISLVSMGHHHNQPGHHPGYLDTAGHHNKPSVEWNITVPPGGESINNVWHNPMQNYEQRKEGQKKVTWSELVHVRTIEPCPGQGRGRWHHPHHAQRQGGQWEESKQTSFSNLLTSPIYDLWYWIMILIK